MTCECGFKFSGPGEFRNCESVLMQIKDSHFPEWINICPDCGRMYWHERLLKENWKEIKK